MKRGVILVVNRYCMHTIAFCALVKISVHTRSYITNSACEHNANYLCLSKIGFAVNYSCQLPVLLLVYGSVTRH